MANVSAFQPQGKTVLLSATATSSSASVPGDGDNQPSQYRIVNDGPNDAYLAFGGAGSSPTAVIPTGTSAYGMKLKANTVEVFNGPPNAVFAAICASAQTCSLWITPGEGL